MRKLSLFLLPLLLMGCPDDLTAPNRTIGNRECLTEIGTYRLSADSQARVPYRDSATVTFLNPDGEPVPFTVNDIATFSFPAAFEGTDAGGNPTVFCYDGELRSLTLESNFADFFLSVAITTAPNIDAGEAAEFADVLVAGVQTGPGAFSHRYTEAIDLRNSSAAPPTVVAAPDTAYCSTTFPNARRTPGQELYYSAELGIVSFLDPDGGRWCYSSN